MPYMFEKSNQIIILNTTSLWNLTRTCMILKVSKFFDNVEVKFCNSNCFYRNLILEHTEHTM